MSCALQHARLYVRTLLTQSAAYLRHKLTHLYNYALHENRIALMNGSHLRSCLDDEILEERQCIQMLDCD